MNIDAGAKALFLRELKYFKPTLECPEPPNWEDLTEVSLEHYRGNARAVINSLRGTEVGPEALEKAKDAFDEAMGMNLDNRREPWYLEAPSNYRNFAVEPAIRAYLESTNH